METNHYEREESLMSIIYQCSLRVHKQLGPGLLESVYETCLHYELVKEGLFVERQKKLAIEYDGQILDAGLRLDLFVENLIIIELKAIENLLPVHQAQILSYMKLASKEFGFLINFNVKLLKDGVKRYTFKKHL